MEYKEFIEFIEFAGKDPSQLIFEDELTGIYNRRYLHHYLQFKIPWNDPKDYPISLLMIDLDHFKKINDCYGHQMGDKALIWFANIIKKIAGEKGIPVRYAGDEFLILLPFQDKNASIGMAKRLFKKVLKEPFGPGGSDKNLKITLSIGITSGSMSSQGGKDLIQQADTALYYAKKSGRNCFKDSDDVILDQVYPKTSAYQLENTNIVGREEHLAQVTEALNKFSLNQNQFLILKGGPGMGKSEFLSVISHNLIQHDSLKVNVHGLPQEMFRPYYLITNILISILNQYQDKGMSALEGLDSEEIGYLANLLPHLKDKGKEVPGKSYKSFSEGIFITVVRFILKVIHNHPFFLFIDDLDFCDGASFLVLRKMILSGQAPLFICGTYTGRREIPEKEQILSLEEFLEDYGKELGIIKICLTPLSEKDIIKHIEGLFSNVKLPKDFAKDLFQVTQGNPLFLNEILRKLVQDQKITLIGHQWKIESLDENYLPYSLDEIVSQKIVSLDAENRQLLEHISALGEDVALHVISGTSGKTEAEILDFIDKAIAQGLIKSDFQINEEIIHFLSKRILQITYGSIDENRRKEMHERIANYHESLYKEKLLSSAATLAYHFKRSADQERARKYIQILGSWNNKIFDAKEAVHYIVGIPGEFPVESVPLDSANLKKLPGMIRTLMSTVKKINLYPPESPAIIDILNSLKEEIDQILETSGRLTIIQEEQTLVINSQKIDIKAFKSTAQDFIDFLMHLELKGITFIKGVSREELTVLLDAFSRFKSSIITPDFWMSFSAKQNLSHIYLKQVHYIKKDKENELESDEETLLQVDQSESLESPSQLPEAKEDLDQKEAEQVLRIIQALLSVFKSIKLYPQGSRMVSDSVGKLMKALKKMFNRYEALSLSRVKNSLLVNGMKLDNSDFEIQIVEFFSFFDETRIHTLTFQKNITIQELKTFFGLFDQISDIQSDDKFWQCFVPKKKLTNILVNKHLYEIEDRVYGIFGTNKHRHEIQSNADREFSGNRFVIPENFETFLTTVQTHLEDYLIKADQKMAEQIILQLFEEFHSRSFQDRKKIISICQNVLENLILETQFRTSELMITPLSDVFQKEKDLEILLEISSVFKLMIPIFIQFAEFSLAGKLLLQLQSLSQKLIQAKDKRAYLLLKTLKIQLEPQTQRMIINDLKSDNTSNQKKAIQFLGCMGDASIPILIDLIKKEEDFRIRNFAISLLKGQKPGSVDALKRELLMNIKPEQRVRILEVIDRLTHDLKDSLILLLCDSNPQVQDAAFQLAERLDEKYVTEILLKCAKSQEINLATAAIESLGRLKIRSASRELLSLLKSAKKEELIIACCRTLGQIKEPDGIDPLNKLLKQKSFFGFRKRRSADVRTAAAMALAQISHPKGIQVLAAFMEDPELRVREIAKAAVNHNQPVRSS